jgi:hypothetical protein
VKETSIADLGGSIKQLYDPYNSDQAVELKKLNAQALRAFDKLVEALIEQNSSAPEHFATIEQSVPHLPHFSINLIKFLIWLSVWLFILQLICKYAPFVGSLSPHASLANTCVYDDSVVASVHAIACDQSRVSKKKRTKKNSRIILKYIFFFSIW